MNGTCVHNDPMDREGGRIIPAPRGNYSPLTALSTAVLSAKVDFTLSIGGARFSSDRSS